MILNSLSWEGLISVGASVKRHADDCVLGNAIVSLIEGRFISIIINLSKPNAIPACGGHPYSNALRKKPNFFSISSSVRPNALKTFSWSDFLWIRTDPPPISLPFRVRSYALDNVWLVNSSVSSSNGDVNGWWRDVSLLVLFSY